MRSGCVWGVALGREQGKAEQTHVGREAEQVELVQKVHRLGQLSPEGVVQEARVPLFLATATTTTQGLGKGRGRCKMHIRAFRSVVPSTLGANPGAEAAAAATATTTLVGPPLLSQGSLLFLDTAKNPHALSSAAEKPVHASLCLRYTKELVVVLVVLFVIAAIIDLAALLGNSAAARRSRRSSRRKSPALVARALKEVRL